MTQQRGRTHWSTALPETFTRWAGSLWISTLAMVVVAALTAVGVVTGFPQWWQTLVYSLGALVSVLMLFLIQHTTNRENNAVLVKLDELVTAVSDAREDVIDIEDRQLSEQEEVHDRLHHDGDRPGHDGGTEDGNGERPVQRAGDLPIVTSLQEIVDVLGGNETVYLRYSKGPDRDAESDGSRDYESHVEMPGFSVSAIAPETWWPRPPEEWIARRIRQYAELCDDERFPWLLTGRQVGSGPDHEPLLTDIRPLARLDRAVLQEAADVYRNRFDVGNDSRSEHRRR
jgi:low affinity Fe/Cu permease